MQEKNSLTEKEVEQRVAILKRFKTLLQEQRDKFNQYLTVLEAQQKSISDENVDSILKHTEMEQSIIKDIFRMQKAVDPIERMFKLVNPPGSEEDVIGLKNDLEKLQNSVLEQNKKNRELLEKKMNYLRQEIASIKPVPKYAAGVYSESANTGSYVDINS